MAKKKPFLFNEKIDLGTPERAAKFGGLVRINGTTRVKCENRLDFYHLSGTLAGPGDYTADERHEAGATLWRDFKFSGIEPSLSLDLSKIRASNGLNDFSEKQMTARLRFREAMASLCPVACSILWDVCCCNCTLTDIENKHEYRRSSGFAAARLCESLDDLRLHYEKAKRLQRNF